MAERVDRFDSTYSHFTDCVLDGIRKAMFGVDVVQTAPRRSRMAYLAEKPAR